jgi:hypothetical protein
LIRSGFANNLARMSILSSNAKWESFRLRALPYAFYGDADIGECVTTVERIGSGSADEWYREWIATAPTGSRFFLSADASAKGKKSALQD